jgi:hypothetical protein
MMQCRSTPGRRFGSPEFVERKTRPTFHDGKATHLQFLNIMHEYVWKSVRKLIPCYLAQGDTSSHLHQLLPQFSRL